MRLSLIALAWMLVAPLSAQQGDSPAPVDVVSIKAAKGPDDPRRLSCGLPYVERTNGRVWIPFSQVCGLLRVAYDLSEVLK